jgi:hypothetical protein
MCGIPEDACNSPACRANKVKANHVGAACG